VRAVGPVEVGGFRCGFLQSGDLELVGGLAGRLGLPVVVAALVAAPPVSAGGVAAVGFVCRGRLCHTRRPRGLGLSALGGPGWRRCGQARGRVGRARWQPERPGGQSPDWHCLCADPVRGRFWASGSPSHVVDVINTAKCNMKVTAGCRVVARARVGSGPLAAAVDQRTDAVYVANGNSSTVSVLDGGRRNARVTRGRARPVATIKVEKLPIAVIVNPATRTLYVADLGAGPRLGEQRGL
jgi:DNA-binding beta-propeller fold protein YncE